MIVITPTELRSHLKKYLDLAKTETVMIRRGEKDTFILSPEQCLAPDDDLARAISMDELLTGVKEDIREIYRKKR